MYAVLSHESQPCDIGIGRLQQGCVGLSPHTRGTYRQAPLCVSIILIISSSGWVIVIISTTFFSVQD